MPIPSTVPAYGDDDLPALFADMGVPVTVGGVSGIGFIDDADEILVQDQVRGQVVMLATTLTVQTSQFPAAAIGQVVSVNAKTFTIRERLRIGDGGVSKFLLGAGS